ncbi:unnamed protein product [Boreogadus saida]
MRIDIYRDKNKTNQAWKEIGEEFGLPGLSTVCMRGQILMSPITGELRLGPLIDNDDMFHHVACRALTERGRGSDGV